VAIVAERRQHLLVASLNLQFLFVVLVQAVASSLAEAEWVRLRIRLVVVEFLQMIRVTHSSLVVGSLFLHSSAG
jgi:hypothetical protein